ncbi:GAF domain-containing sensor histidine kinase [Paenibacillus eucommiae]|uniref:histidine kinase n=1 Tax=Paenibacillus eucommiae TaxID=1355755 RepID=A0ABS4IS43_9BACL|nr:ATP-binding protein [Paenibacillus eucommiae]MBP1990392.1 signal transduction histidine kinase [Paenibacillus eucommiae]
MELKSMKKLFHMTKMINSRFELEEILQLLVEAVASEIAEADLVGFFMKQPDGKFLGVAGNKMPIDITKLVIDPNEDLFAKGICLSRTKGYIADTSKDLRADKNKVEILKIKSLLGIPVLVDDDIFGLVFIHDFGKPMNLTEEQIEVAEAFVNMVSVAIHNIQMFRQTNELLSKQQLLLDATNVLSKSLSTNDVLNACFYYMGKAANLQDVGIHLYNEKERILKPYHLSSQSQITEDEWKNKHKDQEIRLSIDNDLLFSEVVRNKKAVAIPDVYADPRPNHEACRAFDIHSLLAVPLLAKGMVLGVVAIPSMHKPTTYSESQIEFCQSIADVTATALSNAIYAENLDSAVKESTAELEHANLKLEELVKELRYLNELKNDFISSLSHELRTPITAIKGSVDILKRGILGALSEAQVDLIETLNKAIERLLNQVNEFLDFTKLENGRFDLSREETVIDEVISEAARILGPLMDKKRQTFIVESDPNIRFNVDRQRVLQVLLNLMSNANKFTPEGGSITIRSQVEDGNLSIEVEDSGIGIPFEKTKHVFVKFFQVNNQMNGTGLGLAISKQLVELHGGRISFETQEGQGTTFKFTIPTKEAGL